MEVCLDLCNQMLILLSRLFEKGSCAVCSCFLLFRWL
ncbi:hypothetical protein BVRB_9g212450 isoform A [Beta vulgaris subsp. vulgaris]|nr:hypothetical protein BVRB_9g212450 isoform A [Beta vulgaris subsp. vulgaris]